MEATPLELRIWLAISSSSTEEATVNAFLSPEEAWKAASNRPLSASAAALVLAQRQETAQDLALDALSIAEPGELLGDATFWDLVRPSRTDDDAVVERGTYELGHLRHRTRLFRVGQRAPLPPFVGISSFFIGRTREMAEARRLFELGRILSVVGPAGVGKSAFLARLVSHFEEDFAKSYWIDLSQTELSEPIGASVAQLTNIRKPSDQSSEEALIHFIGDQAVLLAIDGFDDRIAPVRDFIARIAAACPNVAFLTASSYPVGSPGEIRYTLGGLDVPTEAEDPEKLFEADAIALFIDRAQEVNQEFRCTARNLRATAELTRRLCGNPLAITAVARKALLLSPQQILNRLDRLPAFLSGPLAPSMKRWHSRLSDRAVNLLHELAMYRGSFTVEDAEALQPGQTDVAEIFSELVEANFLAQTPSQDAKRFIIYPLYASLFPSATKDTSDDLILRWSAAIETRAQQAAKRQFSDSREDFESIAEDVQHLISLAINDARLIAAAMNGLLNVYSFWIVSGNYAKGYESAQRVLVIPGASELPGYPRFLLAASGFAAMSGHATEGLRFARHAIRGASTPELKAKAWHNFGNAASILGKKRTALHATQYALFWARQSGSAVATNALCNIVAMATQLGKIDVALAAAEELYATVSTSDRIRCYVELNYGDVLIRLNRLEEAQPIVRSALERFDQLGNPSDAARCLRTLAQLEMRRSNFEVACRYYTAAASIQMDGWILESERDTMEDDLNRIRQTIGDNRYFELRISDESYSDLGIETQNR
jgi:tetratricopeptide (TPR) repeat protein